MGNRDNKKTWLGWLSAVVIVGAVAFTGGYYFSKQSEPVSQPVNEEPAKQTPDPTPTPQPEQTPDPTPTPTPQPSDPGTPQTPAPAGDVIAINAYDGSGSLDIRSRGLENGAFRLKNIDWSDTSRTLYVSADMRAFEGVAYFRVKDENGTLLEPESVLRATQGAPAWSPVQAQVPLVDEYRGKVLVVEFYAKSAKDGSRINILPLKIKPE
ncbi:immunoglobulin-like protein involved in spore germination [Tumebacillus sp. BK434]|uniref:Gmad2 immunoglobulin-like domain-containing protein n=1 Tax=Tumebacillus sp. BK434 TaxID=2512169 RepID=UPI00105332C5|nr:Gmad2 immunoglobulin-like domain-containing protein [Tumebacillus sp. BK434]TCP55638.1 immunoglobulin-like protein involved in spore germination [Tumebacillus sp. BK434]